MGNGLLIGQQYQGQWDYLLLDAQVGDSDGVWVDTINVCRVSFTVDQLEDGAVISIQVSNANDKPTPDSQSGIELTTFHPEGGPLVPPGSWEGSFQYWFRWTKAKKISSTDPVATTVFFHGLAR